ncbi:Crp/Fnr family transcriptional regulator [Aliagarivorans marinus]|uniref:Crp/Fnr family transcriptional regulator n=1 Tax=Aliagarivorans marinus TaxID=561965 RepID=UPI000A06297C|nr:Crp/Fnr family transcriptional regulator [Aliagarivorans marinus]
MPKDIRHYIANELETIFIKAKESLYRSGFPAKGIYYIEEGLIGLYQVSESGKESLLRLYGPGSYFGYRTLFTNQCYPSTARAMSNSKIVKARINDYKSLEMLAPELTSYLMKEVCSELGEAEKRLLQFNSFSSKKRIIDTIYYVFKFYPDYPWTYREIGEHSGTDTTTVIRFCKTLKAEGILDVNSRKPKPSSLEGLSQYRKTLVDN